YRFVAARAVGQHPLRLALPARVAPLLQAVEQVGAAFHDGRVGPTGGWPAHVRQPGRAGAHHALRRVCTPTDMTLQVWFSVAVARRRSSFSSARTYMCSCRMLGYLNRTAS